MHSWRGKQYLNKQSKKEKKFKRGLSVLIGIVIVGSIICRLGDNSIIVREERKIRIKARVEDSMEVSEEEQVEDSIETLAWDSEDETEYPIKYGEFVEKYAKQYELEPSLVYAVILIESNFNPDVESEGGACGIMQMMPATFDAYQRKRNGVEEYTAEALFDPEICIDYGCCLLRDLLDYYDGNERNALAAYNAGCGSVDSWLDSQEYSDDGVNLRDIPYSETERYVEDIEVAKELYKNET